MGNVQEQQDADDVSVQHVAAASSIQKTVYGHAAQQPLQGELVDNQQGVALQQDPEDTESGRVTRNQAAVDETNVNPLSDLVNYTSSDDEA